MESIVLSLRYLPAKFRPDLSSGSKVMSGTSADNAQKWILCVPNTLKTAHNHVEIFTTVVQ